MTTAFFPSCCMLFSLLAVPGALAATSEESGKSLLSFPEGEGWSLESMVTAGRENRRHLADDNAQFAAHPRKETCSSATDADRDADNLRRQVRQLKVALGDAQSVLDRTRTEKTTIPLANEAAAAGLQSRTDDGTKFAEIVALKMALTEKDRQLNILTARRHALEGTLDEKNKEAATLKGELDNVKARLAGMEAQVENPARLEALMTSLLDRDNALADALKRADTNEAELGKMKREVREKDASVRALTAALDARSQELKAAAATLAEMRKMNRAPQPSTAAEKKAYMAGIIMGRGLSERLDGWRQADVNLDDILFRRGLSDGLDRKMRLSAADAEQAKKSFMQSVQSGVVRQLEKAEDRLRALGRGRTPLSAGEGITWYREREGKPVQPGGKVTLSMLEKIADGRVISRVPPLTLGQDDDVPPVVKGGMYLPGVGGEVVGYALARTVYGSRQLPAGIQPFTVMEYRLTGLKTQTAREGGK